MELHAIIFHHNDLDGRLAGYIMYNWLKSKIYIDKIKTYEVDYNMNIPFDDLIQGKNTRCAFVSKNSITQGETVSAFFSQSQEPKATRRMKRKRNCGKPGFLRSKK